jgi:hypothetical protein
MPRPRRVMLVTTKEEPEAEEEQVAPLQLHGFGAVPQPLIPTMLDRLFMMSACFSSSGGDDGASAAAAATDASQSKNRAKMGTSSKKPSLVQGQYLLRSTMAA